MKPINVTLIGEQIVVTIDGNLVVRSDIENKIKSSIICDVARANGVIVTSSCSDIFYFNGISTYLKPMSLTTVKQVVDYIRDFGYPIIGQALIIHKSEDI